MAYCYYSYYITIKHWMVKRNESAEATKVRKMRCRRHSAMMRWIENDYRCETDSKALFGDNILQRNQKTTFFRGLRNKWTFGSLATKSRGCGGNSMKIGNIYSLHNVIYIRFSALFSPLMLLTCSKHNATLPKNLCKMQMNPENMPTKIEKQMSWKWESTIFAMHAC